MTEFIMALGWLALVYGVLVVFVFVLIAIGNIWLWIQHSRLNRDLDKWRKDHDRSHW